MSSRSLSDLISELESTGWKATRLRSNGEDFSLEKQRVLELVCELELRFEQEPASRTRELEHEIWLARSCAELVPRHEAMHRQLMEDCGQEYLGVYDQTKRNRNTHCWNCKRKIIGTDFLVCKSCNGVICDACGNCLLCTQR